MPILLSGIRLKAVEFTEKRLLYLPESAIRSPNNLDLPDIAPSGAFLNRVISTPGNEFPGYMISSLTGLRKTESKGTLFVVNRNTEF